MGAVDFFSITQLQCNLAFRVRQVQVCYSLRHGKKAVYVISLRKHLARYLPGCRAGLRE